MGDPIWDKMRSLKGTQDPPAAREEALREILGRARELVRGGNGKKAAKLLRRAFGDAAAWGRKSDLLLTITGEIRLLRDLEPDEYQSRARQLSLITEAFAEAAGPGGEPALGMRAEFGDRGVAVPGARL
jgi:hypothetical protein